MFRALTLCVIVPFIAGCAVLSKGPTVVPPEVQRPKPPQAGEVAVISKPLPLKKAKFGFIIGKTDFQGLLKAAYVRLSIIKRDEPAQQYYFYVGSKSNQSVVPWGEGKVIEPGYFVLELPPGLYKVTSIAIPVGSTIAEEGMELDFDVIAGKAVYVGSLNVEGTKERIKFGGVPLIRPGFDYKLSVTDDFAEAGVEAHRLLPDARIPLVKNMFVVVASGNGIPTSNLLWPNDKK